MCSATSMPFSSPQYRHASSSKTASNSHLVCKQVAARSAFFAPPASLAAPALLRHAASLLSVLVIAGSSPHPAGRAPSTTIAVVVDVVWRIQLPPDDQRHYLRQHCFSVSAVPLLSPTSGIRGPAAAPLAASPSPPAPISISPSLYISPLAVAAEEKEASPVVLLCTLA